MEEVIEYYPDRVYIYCLTDPRTSLAFYVGQTRYPQSRLAQHCKTSQADAKGSPANPMLKAFMAELIGDGYRPEMRILAYTDSLLVARRMEELTIAGLRAKGIVLQNAPVRNTAISKWIQTMATVIHLSHLRASLLTPLARLLVLRIPEPA